MGRLLRWIPDGGALVEVTTRTLQSRLLLKPSPAVNEIIVGVLGRAKRQHPELKLCAPVFLGSHAHILCWTPDAEVLSGFMRHVNGNVAREIGRHHRWRQKLWGRRYRSIPIADQEQAQVERLKYVLGNSVQERLVERVLEWPGVHAARAILNGEPLQGYWFHRTKEYAARQRGEDFGRYEFATRETLTLDPIPCWADLTPDEYRACVAELVEEVETEAAEERRRSGKTVLGVPAIRRQHPHQTPAKTKKQPAPLVHAWGRKTRKLLRDAYAAFLAAYRLVAEDLKNGNRDAAFPEGSFPPGLPFVPAATARAP